jgi:hypothetical protein
MERRVLTFAAGDKKFQAFYNLAVLGHLITAQIPKGQADSRDLAEARLDAKFLRAAHAISEPTDEMTSTREKQRRCTGGELVMTAEVYERVTKVVKMALPRVSDEILLESEDALDALIACKEQKDEKEPAATT